jgi:hypothetical protein
LPDSLRVKRVGVGQYCSSVSHVHLEVRAVRRDEVVSHQEWGSERQSYDSWLWYGGLLSLVWQHESSGAVTPEEFSGIVLYV